MNFYEILERAASDNSSAWAWTNYLAVVQEIAAAIEARDVIELGAGRNPAFSEIDVARMGVNYVANDSLAAELSLAPRPGETACFNLGAGLDDYEDRFDLAFSRMVMEHVRDFRPAYRDICTLLRPGGVSIAFHPVPFALPFTANRLLPEWASRPILKLFTPDRGPDGIPKFPAYYSGCSVSRSVREAIEAAGFAEVWQLPFYGHSYYERIPLVRDIHVALTKRLRRGGPPWAASFVWTIARK